MWMVNGLVESEAYTLCAELGVTNEGTKAHKQ